MKKEKATKKEAIPALDKEGLLELIGNYIQTLPNEEKSGMTYRIIYEAIIWGSRNDFEAMGILEIVKLDYIETAKEMWAEEEEKRLNEKPIEEKTYRVY